MRRNWWLFLWMMRDDIKEVVVVEEEELCHRLREVGMERKRLMCGRKDLGVRKGIEGECHGVGE